MRALHFLLRRQRCGALVSGILAVFCTGEACRLAAKDAAEIKQGRLLFEHEWQLNDPQCLAGDGLGPMFNARSCVECHGQGGVGGGGSNEHNVDLVTVVGERSASAWHGKGILPKRERLALISPGFQSLPTVPVHRFGSEPEYQELRSALLGRSTELLVRGPNGTERTLTITPIPENRASAGQKSDEPAAVGESNVYWIDSHRMARTQRNTPALFGSGLIDKVTKEQLEAIAAKQPHAVRGRVVGRFGWRGQTASLRSFVRDACANELGLQTRKHAQARDPLQPDYRSEEADMTRDQMVALVGFVASLPPPKENVPRDPELSAQIKRGGYAFYHAKCAVCHVESVGPVLGIYSDLLVHDMGTKLSDVVPSSTVPVANTQEVSIREVNLSGRPSPPNSPRFDPFEQRGRQRGWSPEDEDDDSSSSVGYYMGSAELARSWRTPPLWGVRDSAPYLHDGRAATLDEAIRAHGGQAMDSAYIYRERLDKEEREDLLAFVTSLGAP